MSDEIRVNRVQTQPVQQSSPMRQETKSQEEEMGSSKSSKMPWVILAFVVVVIIILGVLFRAKLFKTVNKTPIVSQSSGYQAVFLTNGQVYFGKIGEMSTDFLTMSDIYYLQVVQPPLQGTPQAGQPAAPTAPAAQPTISLVKLGNELHGPVDLMHISRAQILFYEDLKSDGSVVKAIDAYKANPTGTAPAPVK